MSIKEEWKRASKRGRKRAGSESPRAAQRHGIPESAIREPRVQAVIDFMNTHLHRRIRLTELAEEAKISASRLSHIFKTEMGLPPGEYLRRLRMQKARDLLTTSRLSVKQIMAMAGYDSKGLFVRHFRRSSGLAPSEYRKAVSTR
jgi:transcriptional regulator GlxA family with amidase domain